MIFKSSIHERFEQGRSLGKTPKNVIRLIELIQDASEPSIYYLTIYMTDQLHPIWRDNVIMGKKRMVVVDENHNCVTFRGHGSDPNGHSFGDYGFRLYHDNGTVTKCVGVMHDRNIEIHYYL